jgi:hypothetical protein
MLMASHAQRCLTSFNSPALDAAAAASGLRAKPDPVPLFGASSLPSDKENAVRHCAMDVRCAAGPACSLCAAKVLPFALQHYSFFSSAIAISSPVASAQRSMQEAAGSGSPSALPAAQTM